MYWKLCNIVITISDHVVWLEDSIEGPSLYYNQILGYFFRMRLRGEELKNTNDNTYYY